MAEQPVQAQVVQATVVGQPVQPGPQFVQVQAPQATQDQLGALDF